MDQYRGALASQHLKQLLSNQVIQLEQPLFEDQLQPASLDLRLGAVAYRVRTSFLPGIGRSVQECIDKLTMHEINLSDGAVLERGCVYIVPLQESLMLPPSLAAAANPKSSTGRLDVFTRLITDEAREFDQVVAGYQGKLYAEICPQTFSVLVRSGSRLSQLRVRAGESFLDDSEHVQLHQTRQLTNDSISTEHIRGGIPLTADVLGEDNDGLVGYRAKRHAGVVDVDKVAACAVSDFWEPIYANDNAKTSGLILDPGEFYILVSREAVHVPVDHAAEMVAYDNLVGEFRVHYAGFFDPGFGAPEAGGEGSRAVLEVRSYEVPFLLEHGQYVGRLVYESLSAMPETVYGVGLSSNYQSQGLKLSKHFQDV
ncbi:MAG: 2'-deoxycytidine 5'-triphosphate deaminase [Arenicella sp.]